MAKKMNVRELARYNSRKSGIAIDKAEGGADTIHPAARSSRERQKPAETAMAPREGNKRKEYGRKMEDKPTLKGGKYK